MTGAGHGWGRGTPVRANVVQVGGEGISASTYLDINAENSRLLGMNSEQ